MEWSTGLDEDAAESSETLEERSMKKSGVVSLSSFSSSSTPLTASLVTPFFCHHNTYMYYFLYVIVLSCVLRIHFLLFRETKRNSNRKSKLITSQPLRSFTCSVSPAAVIACSGHNCYWRRSQITGKSSVFVTLTAVKAIPSQEGSEAETPCSLPISKRNTSVVPATRVLLGTRFQFSREHQQRSVSPTPVAPKSVSTRAPLLLPDHKSSIATTTQALSSLSTPLTLSTCCYCHFGLSKHNYNNISSINNRHHFRKGHTCGDDKSVTAYPLVVDCRKSCKRIITSSSVVAERREKLPLDATPISTTITTDVIVKKQMMRMCALLQQLTFENIQLNKNKIGEEIITRIAFARMMIMSSLFT